MDEDRLSPELGRLIDRAKAAVSALGVDIPDAEGVALLTGGGTVHCGAAAPACQASVSAAQLALERALSAGDAEVLAAAVAAPFDPADTVMPTPGSYACLADLDPELPLVVKQDGRWVMLAASKVNPS
jgi:hypothetical protein